MMLVDALQCGHFDRKVIEDLRKAGVGCVTSTLGFWETAIEAMDAIAWWRDFERDNADVMTIARTTEEIRTAQQNGRIAVVLGFQNATLFDGRIGFVELFADMGIR